MLHTYPWATHLAWSHEPMILKNAQALSLLSDSTIDDGSSQLYAHNSSIQMDAANNVPTHYCGFTILHPSYEAHPQSFPSEALMLHVRKNARRHRAAQLKRHLQYASCGCFGLPTVLVNGSFNLLVQDLDVTKDLKKRRPARYEFVQTSTCSSWKQEHAASDKFVSSLIAPWSLACPNGPHCTIF